MTTTGTTNYNPAASNLTLAAYSRIRIRREMIESEHMADADTESNLVMVKFGNRQPNLWTSQLLTLGLTAGTATYVMPSNVIALQAVFLTTSSGGTSNDRIVWPYSTFEYAAIPNKTQQAPPTAYWYDRQIIPQITLWPIPDAAATYTINVRCLTQIQDVNQTAGQQVQLPWRWLDVYVADLAYRLSRIYAPDLEPIRKVDAEEAWRNAATEDEERVHLYVLPQVDAYWR